MQDISKLINHGGMPAKPSNATLRCLKWGPRMKSKVLLKLNQWRKWFITGGHKTTHLWILHQTDPSAQQLIPGARKFKSCDFTEGIIKRVKYDIFEIIDGI